MRSYSLPFWILFILFVLVNLSYLHRVPGLMGDEASEGQNVYELLDRGGITIMGERSYIGPLIDYIRVPFIKVFGYTALAVRLPMLLASLATFLLAASVLRRWFGEEKSLFPLIALTFSLPYLAHQRLGWAITLFPFFFFLTIWLAQRNGKHKWLGVGLAAGLGLHTHIMFAPTVAALFASGFISHWWEPASTAGDGASKAKGLLKFLLAAVGFWAGFGTQFAVLQLFTEDQGDPVAVGEVWTERLAALPDLLPVILSGSSYVAHYTGVEFSSGVAVGIMWLVIILAFVGVILAWRNKYVWLWVAGLAIHLLVLLYMIDRFSLRYFLMFTLGVYVLAGVGVGELVVRFSRVIKKEWFVSLKALGLAMVLSLGWIVVVLVPFLRTGGGITDFSLGNRTDSATALVDVRPLVECLVGQGSVSSENVHIYNRLLYMSHEYSDLKVIHETEAPTADFLVHYRRPSSPVVARASELCPGLAHFIVERKQ